jgi:hypothetical protein
MANPIMSLEESRAALAHFLAISSSSKPTFRTAATTDCGGKFLI